MAESKPAVSKSTLVFVAGLVLGLIVGGFGGVYIATQSDSTTISIPKSGSGKNPAAAVAPRTENPGGISGESAPEPKPENVKPEGESPAAPATPK